jgi:DNA polymerase-1
MIMWSEIPPHGSYKMQDPIKNKYKSIFAQIKNEHAGSPVKAAKRDDHILVVDGLNQFIRAWVVVPTLSSNGDHVGGVSGFLSSLGCAIKLLRPTRVIVVFDGKGGSERRRKMYPQYKEGRSVTKRLNRAYEEMSDGQTEQKSVVEQMGKLVSFLQELPVSIVSIDHIEADDTIGYIATQMYKDSRITIMSADKDFMQLVNDRVQIWSPVKKKIYGVQDIINEYGIHPINFIYYRILEGDTSDNIDGVKGVGLKTAIKSFPMLTESTETSVEKIILRAKDCINEKKVYSNIVENAEIVQRNYMLMQLKDPNFAPALQLKIEESVERIHKFNKLHFIQKLTSYGMHSSISNFHVWLQEVFYPLSVLATS